MTIEDGIAAAQSAIQEYRQLQQQLADQENQLATAALQHGNDQQAIAKLTQDLTDADTRIDTDAKMIDGLTVNLTYAKSQLALLQSTVTYPDLESNPWKSNTDKSVGGSGLGTGGWKAPSVECAELWILDQAGVPAPNYVDCYNTQRVPTDGTKTRFKLEASFLFPAAADIAACQCLEFEIRQVTDDKKMVIIAGQLQYSGGQLRYFDWQQRAWLPFGVPIQKPAPLTWVSIVVEGHRDATTVYYDAMTLNGVRTPMTQNYPLLATDWSPLLWVALQLDDTSAVNGYRVKLKDVSLTVS